MNAPVGWALESVVTAAAAVSFASDASLWGGFSLLLAVLIALPAARTRDWTAMVPWPLLVVAAIAVTFRTAGVYADTAGSIAIATLALVIVVELDVFTTVRLSRRFAVGFALLTTLALEALWIVAQFLSDLWLGTEFLRTQAELQDDILVVTVAGFAIAGLFFWYFSTFEPAGSVDGSSTRGGTP